jgi:peptidyl-prolyl cis-trans isomerase SurA
MMIALPSPLLSRCLGRCLASCLALVVMAVVLPGKAAAQETQRVAAVVNDEIVSLHDLEERLKLVMLSSGLPDTVETRSRIVPQVLRRLIDERLQTQEATRLKISVSTDEISNGIANIEHNNRMAKGGFEALLKSRGVDPETARQQVRAEISWIDVVRHELMPQLQISEESVDERLRALKANFGKPEYSVAEIFLAVDDIKREEEVRGLAERLIEQMKQGAPFSALAMQFSQTGAAGGNLGWVSEGMLDDQLMKALTIMQPGSVSPPIRTIDGYHILLLMDKRQVGQGLALGTTYDVLAVDLNSLPSATADERDAQLQRLRDALSTGKSCEDFQRLTKTVPSATANLNSNVALSQIPEQLRELIANLPPGQLSNTIESNGSRRMFVVCDRHEDAGGLPSRETIRRRMEDEQLDVLARRYLRDLRRSAFIELRL